MDDASLEDFLDAGQESSDEANETVEDADPDTEDGSDGDASDGDTTAAEPTAVTDRTGEAATEAETDRIGSATDDLEPARSTMTFSPEPAACGACGESVTRRWTDGDALVCRECKEW